MYSRFKALQNFDENKLEKLQNSTAAVVGLGATGSVIAEHLARHGVKLIIIDRDYLEPKDSYSSNLYDPEQCQKALPKAEAAAEKLSELTEVEKHRANMNPENISILNSADIMMDGTDNLKTRFLLNEYSKQENIPWIYTAALGQKGYSMLFKEECFNCLFDEISGLETCERAGIMREISGIAASKSALKAVNYLSGEYTEEELEVIPSGERLDISTSGCKVCVDGKHEYLESSSSTTSVCGKDKYHVDCDVGEESFKRLKDLGDLLAENEYLVRAKVDGRNLTLFRSGRAIVEAKDEGHAEQTVSEVLGL